MNQPSVVFSGLLMEDGRNLMADCVHRYSHRLHTMVNVLLKANFHHKKRKDVTKVTQIKLTA